MSNIPNLLTYEVTPLSVVDKHHPTFAIEFSNSNVKFMRANKSKKINFFKANRDNNNGDLMELSLMKFILHPLYPRDQLYQHSSSPLLLMICRIQ